MELLNVNQVQYVLFHLNQHVDLSEIRSVISYGSGENESGIFFSASDKSIDENFKITFKGEDIPVLFPCGSSSAFFEMKGNQLVFYHDILKASFYLLSGYQEMYINEPDTMERYSFDESIQKRLSCVRKPLVNYYFEIIAEGIELYCKYNNVDFKPKRLFESFGFMLTHDVDRIDYFHWRETVLKFLQLLGLKTLPYDKKRLVKSTLNSVLPTLFPGHKPNPWWNFQELRKDEKVLGLKSVWYFLNRDGSPHDAKYNLEEKRIKDLMAMLQRQGCEVGLHGSIKTAQNSSAMKLAKERVDRSSAGSVVGARQHFLKFHYPETLNHQQKAGLKYDTTMGFAGHEGFRNSYCYPFHPYDHEKDCMMDIWEFPLTVMDGTLLDYRKLEYSEMYHSFNLLMDEIERFGGLMVVLWHNCNFDEYQYPGIKAYYDQQLMAVGERLPKSVTGKDVLELL